MNRKRKKPNTREEYIANDIHSWLIKEGITLEKIGKEIGKHHSTVANCVRGLTHTPEIQQYIISKMGYSPWEKYPEVNYVPPNKQKSAL